MIAMSIDTKEEDTTYKVGDRVIADLIPFGKLVATVIEVRDEKERKKYNGFPYKIECNEDNFRNKVDCGPESLSPVATPEWSRIGFMDGKPILAESTTEKLSLKWVSIPEYMRLKRNGKI